MPRRCGPGCCWRRRASAWPSRSSSPAGSPTRWSCARSCSPASCWPRPGHWCSPRSAPTSTLVLGVALAVSGAGLGAATVPALVGAYRGPAGGPDPAGDHGDPDLPAARGCLRRRGARGRAAARVRWRRPGPTPGCSRRRSWSGLGAAQGVVDRVVFTALELGASYLRARPERRTGAASTGADRLDAAVTCRRDRVAGRCRRVRCGRGSPGRPGRRRRGRVGCPRRAVRRGGARTARPWSAPAPTSGAGSRAGRWCGR